MRRALRAHRSRSEPRTSACSARQSRRG